MRPRLNVFHRFLVITLLSVAVMGLVQGALLSRTLVANMLDREVQETSIYVQTVAKSTWGSGLPASPDAYRTAFAEMGREADVVRIKIYNPEGTIVWSDDPRLIAANFLDNEELQRALRGEVVVSKGLQKPEHRYEVERYREQRLVEVYVPLFTQEGGTVYGVAEIYKFPSVLYESIDHHRRLAWTVAAGGGLFLFVALAWLFRGALRQEVRLREDLETARQFNEEIIENLNTGIVVLDRGLTVIGWNQRMEGLCRYSLKRQEVLGRPLNQVLAAEEMRALEPELREAFGTHETRTLQGQGWCFCRGAEPRTLNLSIIPVRDGLDAWAKVMVVVDDVTEMVNLQAQVVQSEKLTTLGEISAGLAHEINNPLGIIVSKIKMLLAEGQAKGYPPEVIRDLEAMDRHASRIATVIRNLLTFIRRPSLERAPLDLNGIVRESLAFVEKPYAKMGVRIESDLTSDLPLVSGNDNQLQQVLLNLLGNAKDAMPNGGVIRLRTYVSPVGSPVVEVADIGTGISLEIVGKIFDPFFTTKEEGKGTGLGLSVSYSIVKAHGGEIRVETSPGKGTTFILIFPRLPSKKSGGRQYVAMG
ncbi:MAG: nitrogen regulation protein NR(II) [Candidatus Methylomirabilales bacterium]